MPTLPDLKDLYGIDMSAKFDVPTSLDESMPFGTWGVIIHILYDSPQFGIPLMLMHILDATEFDFN